MRVGLSCAAIGGIAWLTCACSALLDTSSLGPGSDEAGAASVAGGGSSAVAGASAAGESAGGAAAAGAPAAGAPAGGTAAGGAPSNCVKNNKKETCDGIDNDCDASTPDVCPSGCTGFTDEDGRGHMVCSKAVAFNAAQLACVGQGMMVVALDSQAENAEVVERMAGVGTFVWLGAQDEQPNHTLTWPTGGVVATNGVPNPDVYTNFADSQPVVLGGTNCLRMATVGENTGKWSSTSCSDQAPFECEPLLF